MFIDDKSPYERCVFIRAFEQEIAALSAAGEVPGLVHLSTGAEVADVALASVLDSGKDQVTGSHRSHGIALAMGASPVRVAQEILGRVGGLSDGLAGTQHLMAPENGFLTSNGIVGAQVPLAAGAALTAKTNKTGGVGVAVFGDGAANQGAVLETMNLAAALELPMIFALYNNGMAQSTPVGHASGETDFKTRAQAFGLLAFDADGADYSACAAQFKQGAESARGCRPTFVEVTVTRDDGHYFGDLPDAGNPAPTEAWFENLRRSLKAKGASDDQITQTFDATFERAVGVVKEAARSPKAGAAEYRQWLSLGANPDA